MEKKYLGIDIGGTLIKGTLVDEKSFIQGKFDKSNNFEIKKIKSQIKIANILSAIGKIRNRLYYLQ